MFNAGKQVNQFLLDAKAGTFKKIRMEEQERTPRANKQVPPVKQHTNPPHPPPPTKQKRPPPPLSPPQPPPSRPFAPILTAAATANLEKKDTCFAAIQQSPKSHLHLTQIMQHYPQPSPSAPPAALKQSKSLLPSQVCLQSSVSRFIQKSNPQRHNTIVACFSVRKPPAFGTTKGP